MLAAARVQAAQARVVDSSGGASGLTEMARVATGSPAGTPLGTPMASLFRIVVGSPLATPVRFIGMGPSPFASSVPSVKGSPAVAPSPDVAVLREELAREREVAEQAQARSAQALADLRRKHADELLQHAKELSAGFEAVSQRDAELDEARWEARLAEDEWERQKASMEESWQERLSAAVGDAHRDREGADISAAFAEESGRERLRAAENDLERTRAELRTERAALQQKVAELSEAQAATGASQEGMASANAQAQVELERVQLELGQAEAAVHACEAALRAAQAEHEQERRRLSESLAWSEDAVAAIRQTSTDELRDLEQRYNEALGQKGATVAMQQQRVREMEEALTAAQDALERERERAVVSELAKTETEKTDEREHAQTLLELDRLRKQLREETEEMERNKSEADGYRHMLVKITGDLNYANDDIEKERERAGRSVADCDRTATALRHKHADEIIKMGEVHAEDLAQRDQQVNRAWQETQLARAEVTRAREEAGRAVDDVQQAHAEEMNRLRREHADSSARKDAEVERAQQQAQLARDEAQYQRAEVEETWCQRVADAEGNLHAIREELFHERDQLARAHSDHTAEISRLKKAHSEDVARLGTDGTQALQQRDSEVARLRKEILHERREAERKQSEREDMWQQRLGGVEENLKVARTDFQQERERLMKANNELEYALGEMRNSHNDELSRLHAKHSEDLGQRDADIERIKQELRREREQGGQLCSEVDNAWRQRLSDSETDFANLNAELKEAREQISRLKADHGSTAAELRETCTSELARVTQEHARALDCKTIEWDTERRALMRDKDRLERSNTDAEERWQHKVAQAEADLQAARQIQGQEKEKAARAQSECKQSISRLEQTQAEELLGKARDFEKRLQRREAEFDTAREEAKAMKQEAASQEKESQEAWRWLSRVEGDLKTAQKDLKKEHELVAALQAAGESTTGGLKKAHEAQLGRLTEEQNEAIQYRQGELTAVRWELQEARQESTRRLTDVEESWGRRLKNAETEANVARQTLRAELATYSEQRDSSERLQADAARAQREALAMRARAEQEASHAGEAWQQRVAEAEARGAAGVDLATSARVDAQRAEHSLQVCRLELEEAQRTAEDLEDQVRSSADALDRACAVAAQFEMAAETTGGEARRQSEQAWRSVAQNLEGEVANLRVELEEERVPRQLHFSPTGRSPGSPMGSPTGSPMGYPGVKAI